MAPFLPTAMSVALPVNAAHLLPVQCSILCAEVMMYGLPLGSTAIATAPAPLTTLHLEPDHLSTWKPPVTLTVPAAHTEPFAPTEMSVAVPVTAANLLPVQCEILWPEL